MPADEEAHMPIYEYECNQCENQFEALVRSDTVPECPECHSTELKKMLSVFATTASTPDLPPPGPCGSCGNARGPGGCAFN
jgi:putative FmdB family regulatory protein